jgi:hypothetical protein
VAFIALLLIVTALGLLVVGLAGASSTLIATSMIVSVVALVSMMLVRVRSNLASASEQPRSATVRPNPTARRAADSGPVWVIQGRALYHRQTCAFIAGREVVAVSESHAARDGYGPCALCDPDGG